MNYEPAIEAIRDTIKHTGEFRVHILHSRSNLTTTCRMWHWDGPVLGRARGGGYDKAGAALGEAIEKIFLEELKGLKAAGAWTTPPALAGAEWKPEFHKVEGGLYGLTKLADGRTSLDGACGLECMLKVLEALGFKVHRFETGPASTMIYATKRA